MQGARLALAGAIAARRRRRSSPRARRCELELGVDVAHRLGPLAIAGGVTYGQDPEARERDAEEQLGAVVRAGRVWLGVGDRARVSLGTPGSGEPTWDLDAGPHVSLDAHVAVVTAFAGVAARRASDHHDRIGGHARRRARVLKRSTCPRARPGCRCCRGSRPGCSLPCWRG